MLCHGHHHQVPVTAETIVQIHYNIVPSATGRRSLWAELPEVIESGILATIRPEEKKLQEAMFEVTPSSPSPSIPPITFP